MQNKGRRFERAQHAKEFDIGGALSHVGVRYQALVEVKGKRRADLALFRLLRSDRRCTEEKQHDSSDRSSSPLHVHLRHPLHRSSSSRIRLSTIARGRPRR